MCELVCVEGVVAGFCSFCMCVCVCMCVRVRFVSHLSYTTRNLKAKKLKRKMFRTTLVEHFCQAFPDLMVDHRWRCLNLARRPSGVVFLDFL